MSIGAAIGAITFTGSVIAFLKLDGRMSGAPILLPARHVINLGLAVLLLVLVVWFVRTRELCGVLAGRAGGIRCSAC